jgi:hypothetical protein
LSLLFYFAWGLDPCFVSSQFQCSHLKFCALTHIPLTWRIW